MKYWFLLLMAIFLDARAMNEYDSVPATDLATIAGAKINDQWIDRAFRDVLPPQDIERLVLTRAVTSAPTSVDMHNVRQVLARAKVLEPHDYTGFFQPYTWEGVILRKDATPVAFAINQKMICITNEHGYACAVYSDQEVD